MKKLIVTKSPLLQVGSEIEGKLGEDWRNYLGEIIWEMLPAGSIAGAPKNKTLEIIEDVEMHKKDITLVFLVIMTEKLLIAQLL